MFSISAAAGSFSMHGRLRIPTPTSRCSTSGRKPCWRAFSCSAARFRSSTAAFWAGSGRRARGRAGGRNAWSPAMAGSPRGRMRSRPSGAISSAWPRTCAPSSPAAPLSAPRKAPPPRKSRTGAYSRSIIRATPPPLSPSWNGNDRMKTTAVRILCMAGALAAGAALAAAPEPPDPWPDLVRDVFDGRPLAEGTGVIAIDMPARAEDAAIVPVTLRLNLAPGDPRSVKAVTLVIGRNPAPVAATFALGPDAGVTAIETRVRVDSYTDVHAVAELDDGTLHMTKIYVKASGGCSAPAAKIADEAKKNLGQM